MRKKLKKLSLNRETLRQLGGEQLDKAVGGTLRECTVAVCTVTICTGCCTAGDTAASCPGIFSCATCMLQSCGC